MYKRTLAKTKKGRQKFKRSLRKGLKWVDEKGFGHLEKYGGLIDPRVGRGIAVARQGVKFIRKADKASQRMRNRLPGKVRAYIP